jgi:hypothetical protein
MSNIINEQWVEQEYQKQLDKMSGVDDEETFNHIMRNAPEADPDSYKDNLEDR